MSVTEAPTRSARRWLRVRDAAGHLGIGVSTLNKLRLTGGGPKFEELNFCPAYIWEGQGRPGRGWDDWRNDHIPLDVAVALPCGSEA